MVVTLAPSSAACRLICLVPTSLIFSLAALTFCLACQNVVVNKRFRSRGIERLYSGEVDGQASTEGNEQRFRWADTSSVKVSLLMLQAEAAAEGGEGDDVAMVRRPRYAHSKQLFIRTEGQQNSQNCDDAVRHSGIHII